MPGKIINYYGDGNTAKGYKSLQKSNLEGLDRIVILKGGPGIGKSTLMKKIGWEWVDKGYQVEFMHCAFENDSISGVIIPKLKLAIIEGIEQNSIVNNRSEFIEEYINLDTACDYKSLEQHKDELLEMAIEKQEKLKSAYECFDKALSIHDEWEKIYLDNISFEKANEITAQLEKMFFEDKKFDKKSVVCHRFLGGATPIGPVDFINSLTADLGKRYFIKGRPGTGKSTLLKKLVSNAEKKGIDVEVYHCGFDPDSLDMIIIRELDFAIFDSTAPHEYFPELESDEIVDMYDLTITPGTDEKYAQELEMIVQRYKLKINEGTSFLSKAKSIHDEVEKIYSEATNFEKVEKIRKDINAEIEKIHKNIK